MNYITSCPKCDTQFLLSDDHIKAQRGKVQCGHCEHVFNAKNRLIAASDTSENTPAKQTELSEVDISESSVGNQPMQEVDLLAVLDTTPKQTASINETSFQDTYTEHVSSLEAYNSDNQIHDRFNASEQHQPSTNPFFINDFANDTEFKKSSPKKNSYLILFCVLLFLFGLLQAAFFMRTQIAAYYPVLKPLMTQLCNKADCKIDLPKHLEFIVIGESDMQEHENYQSVINFSTSIVNNAGYVQAYPSIELTLTNADDNAVIRKIVLPKAYLPPGTDVTSGIAAHEEIHIKLPVYVDHEVVTGYRVQLIY